VLYINGENRIVVARTGPVLTNVQFNLHLGVTEETSIMKDCWMRVFVFIYKTAFNSPQMCRLQPIDSS
jgi:hypothetical protein